MRRRKLFDAVTIIAWCITTFTAVVGILQLADRGIPRYQITFLCIVAVFLLGVLPWLLQKQPKNPR